MLPRCALVTPLASSSLPASCAAASRMVMARRWASPSSFRAGHVQKETFQVKAASDKALPWQPSAKYMKYKPVRWLVLNAMGLATYQLFLEAGCTVVFGLLIWNDVLTAQAVKETLTAWRYPFTSWISLEDCQWNDAVKVGPFTLNPQKLTAATEGHSIANGLLPVQVLLLAATYPLVMRGYAVACARWAGKPIVHAAATHAATETVAPKAAAAAAPPRRPAQRPSYLRGQSTRLG